MISPVAKVTFLLIDTSDVSRPDRLSSAEIASIVQAAGLQGQLLPLAKLVQ